MRKPDFVVAGCAKCGTTYFHAALDNHPGLFMTAKKALAQFDRFPNDAARLEEYFSNFEAALPNQLAGESTPGYTFYPGALERMRNALGQIKVIILTRDPVNRALSEYWMQVRKCRETLPLREAMIREGLEQQSDYDLRHQSYIQRSCYTPQIALARQLFGPDNVLVIRSEELKKDPVVTVNQAISFLSSDLSPLEKIHVPQKRYNKGKTIRFTGLHSGLSKLHKTLVNSNMLLGARIVELVSKANFRSGGHTELSHGDRIFIRDILLDRDPDLVELYPELVA